MSTEPPRPAQFLAPPDPFSDPNTTGVIVIPVPFEATSTYGRNSANGPAAIIEASQQVEFFDAALNSEPFRLCGGIATLEPLDVAGCDGEALSSKLHEAVKPWLARGRFVITLGGEHTSTIGAIRAHCEHFTGLTVLHLDAHSDLRPAYEGTPWNHACAMARVLDFHDSLVQVGIRSQDIVERRCVEQRAIPVFYAEDIHERDEDREDWIAPIIAATRPRVYLTFDCDVFDPSVIPATGTPEPGGLTWRQVTRLLARLCRERTLVGLDVTELAPVPGLGASEFTIAKLIYRLIGCRHADACR